MNYTSVKLSFLSAGASYSPNPSSAKKLNWKPLLAAACLAFAAPSVFAAENTVIDSMDAMTFHPSGDKAKVEVVDGRTGKALKISFADDSMSVFAATRLHPTPDWDRAAGFSFWVKGDGSNHLGGIELIWNDDYAQRYGYAFPINSTEWKKIMVPWRDLIPEKGSITNAINPQKGNAPSKLVQLSFGKWWYWKDYAAHSYTIDDIRLEPTIPAAANNYRPAGNPLAQVQAKLKAGKPITIVTMGDSLTDYAHWSNKTTNWPTFLKDRIKQKYGSDVTIVNPAMGGTELRQNLVVAPRWTNMTPAPDLVTIFFGGNDWTNGMRGEGYYAAQKDAVERIRQAFGGKADVMIMTTRPGLAPAEDMAEMTEAGRRAARDENAGIADIGKAYSAVPEADRTALYAWDKVHLGQPGQELVAQTVVDALAPK